MPSETFIQNADKSNTIHLPRKTTPWPDTQGEEIIRPFGEVVYVEMCGYERGSASGILFPDSVQRRLRADAGVVISCGPGVVGLSAGARILVRPYDGNWFDIEELAGYVPQSYVRCYGVDSVDEYGPSHTHWSESILATIEQGQRIQAKGPWVFIRRDPTVDRTKSRGGIHLPDSAHHRDGIATVVSVGPVGQERGIKPGQTVHYHQPSTLAVDFGPEFGLDGDTNDYAFIRAEDIYAEVFV